MVVSCFSRTVMWKTFGPALTTVQSSTTPSEKRLEGWMRMSWVGQLVRPRSLDAGGVAGGRNWWRGWWLGLFFHRFFLHFWSPWARKINQNCSKSQNRRKNRKITKKLPKTDQRLFDLGSPNGLEIHQKCRKNGSKKSVKKITLQNTAVLAQGGIFRRKTLRFRGISG